MTSTVFDTLFGTYTRAGTPATAWANLPNVAFAYVLNVVEVVDTGKVDEFAVPGVEAARCGPLELHEATVSPHTATSARAAVRVARITSTTEIPLPGDQSTSGPCRQESRTLPPNGSNLEHDPAPRQPPGRGRPMPAQNCRSACALSGSAVAAPPLGATSGLRSTSATSPCNQPRSHGDDAHDRHGDNHDRHELPRSFDVAAGRVPPCCTAVGASILGGPLRFAVRHCVGPRANHF